MVRWLRDGTLQFLGRADTQVKIRGFRIELSEIEVAIRAHPEIREIIVLARDVPVGLSSLGEEPALPSRSQVDRRLVAYLVRRNFHALHPDARDMKLFLTDRLPTYMIPAHFVFLESLPLNANQKVDRDALPLPSAVSQQTTASPLSPDVSLQPLSQTELAMIEIFNDVLGVPVNVDSDFFDCGGHSLSAARLLLLVSDRFGVDLPFAVMATASTPAVLAQLVTEHICNHNMGVADGTESLSQIAQRTSTMQAESISATEEYPLSYNQRAVWFVVQSDSTGMANVAQNVGLVVKLCGVPV